MTIDVEHLQLGDVEALLRTVSRCPDPIATFRACCKAPEPSSDSQATLRPGTLLLETAETAEAAAGAGKSLVVVRSALHILCRGSTVTIRALEPNGVSLLPWLQTQLRDKASSVEREHNQVTCTFTRTPTGEENSRLKAITPVAVLRTLSSGLNRKTTRTAAAPVLVGTFAYDMLEHYEPLAANQEDPLAWPDYEFWLPDRLIWMDHQRGSSTVVAHLFGGEHASPAYGAAVSSIVRLVDKLSKTPGRKGEGDALIGRPLPVAPEPNVDVGDAEYCALVSKLRQHIVDGDVFQIVPSRTFNMPCSRPLEAYQRLRASNPSPYMFYINGSAGTLFGTSPETAVAVDGQRNVFVRPIAGTRPRGLLPDGSLDLDLDSRYEAELRLSEKEVAEHMMLVDLARNDVARVSEAGTRRVNRLLTVERYSHVMHLVSEVIGTLRHDLDPLHAYVATMNMGTLVGAPKVRAAQLLRQYEARRRGPYGGAVGYLTADGRLDSGIVIRAAVVREGVAYVRAGGGVVYDSDPQEEADETRRKARAVLRALCYANLLT